MGLFSDIDWLIILLAGGILLLGGDHKELLRTAGRVYGRILRLREELLTDLRQSIAETPAPPSAPVSVPPVPAPSGWSVGTVHPADPLPPGQAEASMAHLAALGDRPPNGGQGGGAS